LNVKLRIIDLESDTFKELSQFKGQLFHDWEEFWNKLNYNEKDWFSEPLWLICWLKSFAQENPSSYRLVCFYNQDNFWGAIPFEIKFISKLTFTFLWLSYPFNVYTPCASPALKKEHQKHLFDTIFQTPFYKSHKPLFIKFNQVNDGNNLLNCKDRCIIQDAAPRFWFSLKDQGEKERRSKNHRRKMNKAYNRLKKLENAEFKDIKDPDEMLSAFDELVECEAHGWKGATRHAISKNPLHYKYFQEAIKAHSGRGNLTLHTLRAGSDLMASGLTYENDKVLHWMKVVYNEAYAYNWPGHLLFDYLMYDYGKRQGIRLLNHISSMKWVEVWKPLVLKTFSVIVLRNGSKGRVIKYSLYLALFIRDYLKKK